MSKKVSINLTDEQHMELAILADASGLSINDYVLQNLPITQEVKITVNLIEEKVGLFSGSLFSLPDLFTPTEWKSFSVGSRLAISKQFYKKVNEGKVNVEIHGKTSANMMIYKK